MTDLSIQHLSVRVPWHDNYWNGTVCKNPRKNGSCLALKNVQSKDSELEESLSEKHFEDIARDKIPPCFSEKVTFMCKDQLTRWVIHPYSSDDGDFSHYRYTPIKLPPFSFTTVPSRWMLVQLETTAGGT